MDDGTYRLALWAWTLLYDIDENAKVVTILAIPR
jgi:hypothetical protein